MADDHATVSIQRMVADHHQAVYRYAYRLTGSTADAEDLTQQVFLIAQERLEQLRHEASARGWLLTILRNRFFRMSQRPQPLSASSLGLNLDTVPAEQAHGEAIDSDRLQQRRWASCRPSSASYWSCFISRTAPIGRLPSSWTCRRAP